MKLLALALAAVISSFAAGPAIDKGKAMGNPAAPIKIEIYSDFECPHCQLLHQQTLPRIIADYVKTGKAYLIPHEFPLPQHPHAREAANFATAAARVGKYEQVSDNIFRTQATWSVNGKVWEAVAAVLTPAEQKKVQDLVKEPAILDEVQADVVQAQTIRIAQTPTMIIQHAGKSTPFAGDPNYDLLKSFLDSLLGK